MRAYGSDRGGTGTYRYIFAYLGGTMWYRTGLLKGQKREFVF
jgi:hypothetical protein